ncbi:MAG: hypothetical protein LJE62_07670, partial [Silicimonas sp.]|nr:hypothetical protein [Silicimonas sp.]
GIQRDLVVGQHIGPLLLRRHVLDLLRINSGSDGMSFQADQSRLISMSPHSKKSSGPMPDIRA